MCVTESTVNHRHVLVNIERFRSVPDDNWIKTVDTVATRVGRRTESV
jgi:hypothetical protein